MLINRDVQCTRNVIWNLTIQSGDVAIEIDQKKEMGANITGTMVIPSGKLKLNYGGINSEVGAMFIFPLFTISLPYPPHPGFNMKPFIPAGLNEFGHWYKTINLTAKSNFNLKFNLTDPEYDLNIISQ